MLAEVGADLDRLATPVHRPPAAGAPATTIWQKFALRAVDISYWEQIWRVLILSSVLTFLHQQRDLLSQAKRAELDEAIERLPADVFMLGYTRHPFSIAKILKRQLNTGTDHERNEFVNHERWDLVEEVIGSCLSEDLPMYLIEIDDFDNYWTTEPSIFAEVQAGLALHLINMARGPFTSGQIRVHATVRHTTARFISRNALPQNRFQETVVDIKWTKQAIRKVLASALAREEAIRAESLSELSDSAILAVPDRGANEHLDEYLLRHTTLTPRDCTVLVSALTSRRFGREHGLAQDEIRRIVSEQAELLASSTVHQLVGDLRAMGGRSSVGQRRTAAGDVRQDELKSELIREIERLGRDQFSWHDLQRLIESWDEATRAFLGECLWSYRLVGRLVDETNPARLQVSSSVYDRMTANFEQLMFHPVLHDLCTVNITQGEIHLEYV